MSESSSVTSMPEASTDLHTALTPDTAEPRSSTNASLRRYVPHLLTAVVIVLCVAAIPYWWSESIVPEARLVSTVALVAAGVGTLTLLVTGGMAESSFSRNALRYASSLVVAILACLSVVTIIALLLGGGDDRRFVSLVAMAGAIAWALAYWLLLPSVESAAIPGVAAAEAPASKARARAAGTRASTPAVRGAATTSVGWGRENTNRLLLYGVAMVAVALGALSGALVLAEHEVFDDFIFLFPPLALFPFSWIAYAAFQRNVRFERLKRDFELLEARWSDELANQAQGFWNFALHILLAMLMTSLGLFIFFYLDPEISTGMGLDRDTLMAMRYGFIGALLFCGQLIYRRYTTYDLQPSVYLYCALTILGALIFNFVVFEAINVLATSGAGNAESGNEPTGFGASLVAILAFALGFFPLLAVQWLSRVAYTALQVNRARSYEMPLSLIEGISPFHETRLRDHGIDDIQNLASADIPFLLINTTFSAQQVIDWVDQALLCSHLEQNEIAIFRHGRIRTVSDFRDALHACNQSMTDEASYARLATALQITTEQIEALDRATTSGPNLHYVFNYWKNVDTLLPELYEAKYSHLLATAFPVEYPNKELEPVAENDLNVVELRNRAQAYVNELRGNAVEVKPRSPLAFAGLGYLDEVTYYEDQLAGRGPLLLAISAYEKALTANCAVGKALFERLERLSEARIALGENGRLDTVIETYRKASEPAGPSPQVLERLQQMRQEQVASGVSDPLDETIQWYMKALRESETLRANAIERLKQLAEHKIERSEQAETQAVAETNPSQRNAALQRALDLTNEAIALSRHFYDDRTAKTAYLQRKADLEMALGMTDAAAATRKLAEEEEQERKPAAIPDRILQEIRNGRITANGEASEVH